MENHFIVQKTVRSSEPQI